MRKASDKTKNILAYVAEHPKAKAKQIAEHFGVTTGYVYNLVHKAKKTYEGTKAPLPPVTRTKFDNMAELAYQQTKGYRRHPITGKALMQGSGYAATASGISGRGLADMVNHPAHYKAGGIETIDYIEAKELSYHLGNVIKYVSRADHKGQKLEDLKKAQWYLSRAIENENKNTR